MRSLVALLFACVVGQLAIAADKDEDKAKEAAVALLKAFKAKDIDAAMKVTGSPFSYRDGDKTKILKDEAAVKAWAKDRLAEIDDADKIPTEVQKLVPFAELKDKIKDEPQRKAIEEVVGKDGFIALVASPTGPPLLILVRLKDGKAKVVGIGGR
jgi:hypothetical protein